jgi:hypothetical protein
MDAAPKAPRRPLPLLLALCLALLGGGLLACGSGDEEAEEERHAVEGEALELGPLGFNVQNTRFLNPNLADDSVYLAGLEPAPAGQEYLGVFLLVENDSDEEQSFSSDFELVNARDVAVESVELESPFALESEFGRTTVAPRGEVPARETPARSGPVQGALVLFLIDQADTEYRPLELEITGPGGETGSVELDI